MFKIILSFFIFVLTFQLTAQDAIPTLWGKGKPGINNIQQTEAVLFDQTAGAGTNSLTSQNFEAANDGFDNQGADDFVVPAGATWYIDSVNVLGAYYNGVGPAPSVNVWFYLNNAGFPNSVPFASVLAAALTNPNGTGSFTVSFASPVILPEGSYWISIQVNMDFAAGGQWGWTEHTSFNSESVWQNPGAGFGTPCTSWGYRVTTCLIGTAPNTDFAFRLNGTNVIPVELTSFTATSISNVVQLNWTTATELNNQGFSIERSSGEDFEAVGFIAGHGTTTEKMYYQFVDNNISSGSYSYRLKQVDFDGTFDYSNVVNVEIVAPAEFGLAQNFPNPFNPSTKISFGLAVDSKVKISIYNLLGEQVAILSNTDMTAGSHNVSFDATNLNSGVYFYKLDASGINGQNFSSTKKMILTK
jgi:hypothetical protein